MDSRSVETLTKCRASGGAAPSTSSCDVWTALRSAWPLSTGAATASQSAFPVPGHQSPHSERGPASVVAAAFSCDLSSLSCSMKSSKRSRSCLIGSACSHRCYAASPWPRPCKPVTCGWRRVRFPKRCSTASRQQRVELVDDDRLLLARQVEERAHDGLLLAHALGCDQLEHRAET